MKGLSLDYISEENGYIFSGPNAGIFLTFEEIEPCFKEVALEGFTSEHFKRVKIFQVLSREYPQILEGLHPCLNSRKPRS